MSKLNTLASAICYCFSSCLRNIYGGYSPNRCKNAVTLKNSRRRSSRQRMLHSHGVRAAAWRKTVSALCCAGSRFGQQFQATGLRASTSGCANAKAGFCVALGHAVPRMTGQNNLALEATAKHKNDSRAETPTPTEPISFLTPEAPL